MSDVDVKETLPGSPAWQLEEMLFVGRRILERSDAARWIIAGFLRSRFGDLARERDEAVDTLARIWIPTECLLGRGKKCPDDDPPKCPNCRAAAAAKVVEAARRMVALKPGDGYVDYVARDKKLAEALAAYDAAKEVERG